MYLPAEWSKYGQKVTTDKSKEKVYALDYSCNFYLLKYLQNKKVFKHAINIKSSKSLGNMRELINLL